MSTPFDFPDWDGQGEPEGPGPQWDAEEDSWVAGEGPEPLPWPVDGWYNDLVRMPDQPLWTLGIQPPYPSIN